MAKMYRKSECGKGDNQRENDPKYCTVEQYKDNWERIYGKRSKKNVSKRKTQDADGEVPVAAEGEGA